MSGLPTVAPRLVFHAADIQDLLADLADERASLESELRALEVELEGLTQALPDWDAGGALVREATRSLEAVYGEHRDATLAALDERISLGEQSAAERVATAEREVACQLAAVRSEIGDRLVRELDPDGPGVETPPREPALPAAIAPPGTGLEHATPTPEVHRTAEPDAVGDDEPQSTGWDEEEADTDRFGAFWSEQDEITSIREAVAATLVAIAPMAFALLVIVLLLIIVV